MGKKSSIVNILDSKFNFTNPKSNFSTNIVITIKRKLIKWPQPNKIFRFRQKKNIKLY